MPTRSSAPPKKDPKPVLVFPWLHKDVAKALPPNLTYTWVGKQSKRRRLPQDWSTHVIGKFKCTNAQCGAHWTSKMVAINIKRFADNGYNAFIYSQHCDSCKTLGALELDKRSYVERVARRLQVWAGIELEPAEYTKKKTLPHRSDLCEGCRRGVCRDGED